MMHRPVLSVAPAAEPITLAEAKAHLRVDHDDEDTLIAALVSASVAHLDGWTGILGRCVITQTWVQAFDAFSYRLRLPFPDVSEVVVTYTDDDDQEQTVSATDYTLLEDYFGSYVEFDSGFSRPSVGPDSAGVVVTLTAGYGDADAVPAALKAAMLLHIGTLYEYRETLAPGDVRTSLAYEALIAPYRRVGV